MSENVTLTEEQRSAYRAFGARLHAMHVDSDAFESIIGRDLDIDQSQLKEITTGYIDATVKQSPVDAYKLITGTARHLYNGDFKQVRKAILHELGPLWREQGKHYSSDSIDKLLKDDPKAKALIAEDSIATAPGFALSITPDDQKKDLAAKIVAKHRNTPAVYGAVIKALEILGDKEQVRAVVRETIPYDPDYAALVMRNDCTSTTKDWIAVAEAYAAKGELFSAYFAAEKASRTYRAPTKKLEKAHQIEADVLREKYAQALIKTSPETAFKLFQETRNNPRAYGRQNWIDPMDRVDMDKLRAIADHYLDNKKLDAALEVLFALESLVERQLNQLNERIYTKDKLIPPQIKKYSLMQSKIEQEIKELGLRAFGALAVGQTVAGMRAYQSYRRPEYPASTHGPIIASMQRAAPEWIAQRYDPLLADPYVQGRDDHSRRIMAQAHIKAAETNDRTNHLVQAHNLLNNLTRRRPSEEHTMDQLRERVLEQLLLKEPCWYVDPGTFFANDKKRLLQFVDSLKAGNLNGFYNWAVKLNDEARITEARTLLLAKSDSNTLDFFKRAEDKVGIASMKEKLAPNIPCEIVDLFLPQ
ncbi:hypothetical protein HY492_01520 [Candidatus Woesearchaeota archaeon]|nr:hypothetical protein [Candidatus Woesearchaeota archaeon]